MEGAEKDTEIQELIIVISMANEKCLEAPTELIVRMSEIIRGRRALESRRNDWCPKLDKMIHRTQTSLRKMLLDSEGVRSKFASRQIRLHL